jgi:transposase
MEETIWLGLDVHAGSITICKLVGRGDKDQSWTIPNEGKDIRRTFTRFKQEGEVRACYEAGPCGYELYRQLKELKVPCEVIAPALIPRKPGDRVKTDRRDAVKLARLYRAGELTTIKVPTMAQETARDLVRAREGIRRDRTAARQRLSKYLLRHGRRYGRTGWNSKHRIWLRAQAFTSSDRVVFDHYCAQVQHLDDRLATFDREIQTLARTPEFKPVVDRLCCLKGIAELGAMVIVTELYDLRRFGHPRQLMSFLGLVSSEYSSGEKTRRGRLTKTGNAHVRRVLIESAWAYRYRAGRSERLRRALAGQPPAIDAISKKAELRLTRRYARLVERGKTRPHACACVARELCGFVWAIALADGAIAA